jgi:hypothetical protein
LDENKLKYKKSSGGSTSEPSTPLKQPNQHFSTPNKNSISSLYTSDDLNKLANEFTNPYLRSLFKYVMQNNEAIKSILVSNY